MVVFNYAGSEINTKIVYYGPGLSGKTTNLEYIYSKMPTQVKGKMISMKTRTDRTIFFDFLPLDLGNINGFKLRFLLYTVPGQVYYNATRKLVLKGADAVIFVADSAPDKMGENIDSLKNLEANLNELNLSLDTIPWAIQYNKRDLENALPVEVMEEKLNVLKVPSFEAVATEGIGVYETFQKVSSMVYNRVKKQVEEEEKQEEEKQKEEKQKEAVEVPTAVSSEESKEKLSVSAVVDAALKEVARSKGGASAPREESDEFEFASMEKGEINGDVGRVLDLQDEESAAEESEFITDPCGKTSSPRSEEAQEKKVPASPVTVSSEEQVVTVPVVISRAQVKKIVPIKLVLEISVVDE